MERRIKIIERHLIMVSLCLPALEIGANRFSLVHVVREGVELPVRGGVRDLKHLAKESHTHIEVDVVFDRRLIDARHANEDRLLHNEKGKAGKGGG
jgi:hypothetical protein